MKHRSQVPCSRSQVTVSLHAYRHFFFLWQVHIQFACFCKLLIIAFCRYYREKERHKHQRERNTVDQQEVVHRKVIKPKMEPNTSNEEDENESSEESFQEENIRFKNDMDVSMVNYLLIVVIYS